MASPPIIQGHPTSSASIPLISPQEFTAAASKLRFFFEKKGFLEVHTQNRLSILAACEDPKTVATYNYAGNVWPLPQTGQMWLEYELLKNPEVPGVFCMSTSYRNEENPVEGRHNLIFPMFEWELHGTMKDLTNLEAELLEFLGFGSKDSFPHKNYLDLTKQYDTKMLECEHEEKMEEDFGPVVFLENFPEYTHPFWNMKRNNDGETAKKVDVILHGFETIGSAERSCDPEQMREAFHSIENGEYAKLLYNKFTKERVDAELEDFFAHKFFPRSGAGMGMTRFIRALKKSNLLYT
ncbi:transposase [Candidatus Gracilibacteria bacterium]|nr:transposase [Candidatus Gracilibacteria bacterium]